MKYLVVVASLFLVGCVEDGSDQTSDMITVCLDDVAYWIDMEGTNYQMMSPRIDPDTLSFVRCGGKL